MDTNKNKSTFTFSKFAWNQSLNVVSEVSKVVLVKASKVVILGLLIHYGYPYHYIMLLLL